MLTSQDCAKIKMRKVTGKSEKYKTVFERYSSILIDSTCADLTSFLSSSPPPTSAERGRLSRERLLHAKGKDVNALVNSEETVYIGQSRHLGQGSRVGPQ